MCARNSKSSFRDGNNELCYTVDAAIIHCASPKCYDYLIWGLYAARRLK
ncbi:Uncharacterized protein APZ42_030494 [Daphnia magna]|uniref:Uncharacterized protein n=1 Tax=Daphnia magna TaxID=35525 RepID=A0A164NJT3_9CRUS|nr:Uncharacterized protein APZ42_030494 [Daphnia magna]